MARRASRILKTVEQQALASLAMRNSASFDSTIANQAQRHEEAVEITNQPEEPAR
jgi:hypothetical protein